MLETTDERAPDLSNIYYLKGQITGQGNINRNDVAKIEVLFNQVSVFDLSETQRPTGYYGLRLEQGLKKSKKMGKNGDKVLADLNPEETEHLHRITDGSNINPKTRLLEVYIDIFFQRVI